MDRFFIVGANQETRTVARMLLDKDPMLEIELFVEKGFGEIGSKFHGLHVIGYTEALFEFPPQGQVLLADPDPTHRQRAFSIIGNARAERRFWRYRNALIAPDAKVAASASIGPGAIVMPGAVILDGVFVGQHAIIGPNVTLEAEASVMDFGTVKAGAIVGSKAYVGTGGVCGLGSIVQATKRVGAWSQVTDGFLLKKDLPPGSNTSIAASTKR